MKHAILIIAYNNWEQLEKLIKAVDHENNDIYIHIDRKSKDFSEKDFVNICKYSQLNFYQENKVYWGGYSQVETEMLLFKKASEKSYDYYHLISGMDLPLMSMEAMHKFIEERNGMEFINYDNNKLINDPEISRRTRLYHFLQNYRRRFKFKPLNNLFTFLERVLLVIQIVFRVNRVKNLDWEIRYGSQWVSITDSLVKVLLENETKIKKVFSYTNCADELFIQTIAYNCGFKDNIYSSNCRFIDWERGSNGNPYTFRIEDFELLTSQKECIFARKFDERTDNEIISRIISKG